MDGILAARAPSLTEHARIELERMILDGRLAPGERLSEVALAERLGVSRGPLREALRLLERDGLVDLGEAYRGAFVRRLDTAEIAELYDTRALLQGFTCARLAERSDDAMTAQLEMHLAAMDRALDQPEEFYRLNVLFHHALLDRAAHARTAAIYRGLEKESHLGRRQTMQFLPNRRESQAEHRAIVAAIAARDVTGGRTAGEDHVLSGKRRWLFALGL